MRFMTLADVLKIVCVKLNRIPSSRLGCKAGTDRHRQTQTQTDTLGVRHIQSKRLNVKTKYHVRRQ